MVIILVLFPTLNTSVVEIIAVIDSIFLAIAFVDYVLAYLMRTSKFQAIEVPEKEPPSESQN